MGTNVVRGIVNRIGASLVRVETANGPVKVYPARDNLHDLKAGMPVEIQVDPTFKAVRWHYTTPTRQELAVFFEAVGHRIGPKYAEKIATAIPEKMIPKVIDKPALLSEIDLDMPEALVAGLAKAIEAVMGPPDFRSLHTLLSAYGFDTGTVWEAYRFMRELSQPVTYKQILSDPWFLPSRGFKTESSVDVFLVCDRLARDRLKITDLTNPRRLDAAIASSLWRAARQHGHSCLDWGRVTSMAATLLMPPKGSSEEKRGEIRKQIQNAVHKRLLNTAGDPNRARTRGYTNIGKMWYVWPYAQAEHLAVRGFVHQSQKSQFAMHTDTVAALVREVDTELSQEQVEAVIRLLKQPFSILTGPAGSGKSTVLMAVQKVAGRLNKGFQATATTGQAAERLKGTTLHSYLGIRPGQLKSFKTPSISYLVLDESSMMDLMLSGALANALIEGDVDHLVLAGDDHQLPPVDAGKPFWDLIEAFPDLVIRLDQVFRQENPGILDLANSVRNGQPVENLDALEKINVIPAKDEDIPRIIRELVQTLPSQPMILSTIKDKATGVHALNAKLRDFYNPDAFGEIDTGDVIVQIRTRRGEEPKDIIWNGTRGEVVGVVRDNADHALSVKVRYDTGQEVEYSRDDWKRFIIHRYALTVHRAQGSEDDSVILILADEQTNQWTKSRARLYTAVTRAKKSLTLVGGASHILSKVWLASENETAGRHSQLAHRISSKVEGKAVIR